MNRFENQTAVITGGAQGIGFAIAEKLAGEGAHVWILDRQEEAAKAAADRLAESGAKASSAAVDITDEAQVEAVFATVLEVSGACHVVVNSAGVVGPTNLPTDQVELEGFVETCRVNLTGSFIVLKHALRSMLPDRYGRILLIASIAGKEGNAGMACYSASKAGVIGLVKSAGKEHAESGVTVNGIAPATIRTPMVEGMPAEQVKYMTDRIPMKRCGELREAADLAAWIVSREATFNTGFTFDLTGGRAVY